MGGAFVGKPEGKRPLGRPKRKWVDNIQMDLREIGWHGVDWIDMAQDREYGNEPSVSINAGKFLSGCTVGSSSQEGLSSVSK
jgi:hypothetical protein